MTTIIWYYRRDHPLNTARLGVRSAVCGVLAHTNNRINNKWIACFSNRLFELYRHPASNHCHTNIYVATAMKCALFDYWLMSHICMQLTMSFMRSAIWSMWMVQNRICDAFSNFLKEQKKTIRLLLLMRIYFICFKPSFLINTMGDNETRARSCVF